MLGIVSFSFDFWFNTHRNMKIHSGLNHVLGKKKKKKRKSTKVTKLP